jgi:hypothetical protein
MRVLAKRAIRVSCTARMHVRELEGSTKDKQECQNSDEQNAAQGVSPPNFLSERHN